MIIIRDIIVAPYHKYTPLMQVRTGL